MASTRVLTSDSVACVWIPHFPLRMEECRRPELLGRPTAILAPEATRKVWLASSQARKAGVRPDMTVSQAIGLCPALTLLEADPVYYDERFSQLVLRLGGVSPIIEPAELGCVYVGVDGLERLIGDPHRVIDLIARVVDRWAAPAPVLAASEEHTQQPFGKRRRRWRRDGRHLSAKRNRHAPRSSAAQPSRPSPSSASRSTSARIGWGRGKFTAWVAACRARSGSSIVVPESERLAFLYRQSVATLPLEPDTLRRLWQLDLRTLGNLAALPEAAMVTQFGREGRLAWQLASGHRVEPATGRETPQPIVVTVDFPVPFADSAILVHAMRQLLARALRHPRRIGWRVHRVRVRGDMEQGGSWMIESILREPTATLEHLVPPLRTKLAIAPPTGAIQNLSVEFSSFVPGTAELQLFARDATSAARAGRRRALRWAAKEIRARLKQPMLHHIIEVHPWSRLPERRYALIDFDP